MFGFGKKKTTVIKVNGMHCQRCAEKVKQSVAALKDVKMVAVDLDGGNVTVVSSEGFDINSAKSAITSAGFEVVA